VSRTQIYEPNLQQHFAVYAHSVDFVQESTCLVQANGVHRDEAQPSVIALARASGHPIIGRKVVVVKTNIFRGYRGVIQYKHNILAFFGVRLDATNNIVHLPEDFLVDQL
jgi:hypothetical protein